MKINENQKSTNHQPTVQKPFFGAAPEHAFFSAERAPSPPFFQPKAISTSSPFFQPKAISPSVIQAKSATSEAEEDMPVMPKLDTVQRMGEEEEEMPVMPKLDTLQRMGEEEEEMPVMPKLETVQRMGEEEEEMPVMPKLDTVQRMGHSGEEVADNHPTQQQQPSQKKASPELGGRENNTGLPDNLKSGIENLSGYSMDDVKVHYNSDKPAQLNAHAYAQGTDIHLGSGQEKHLPHEAWHVVQQKQGRVKPTMQMKGKVNINDDAELEMEADVMGNKARQNNSTENIIFQQKNNLQQYHGVPDDLNEGVAQTKVQAEENKSVQPLSIQRKDSNPIQRATIITHKSEELDYEDIDGDQDKQEVGISMTAVLDPTDPVQGTGTTTVSNDLYGSLRSYYPGDNFVQGHLLNARLGGQAQTENLFPITGEANKRHAEFELVAKQAVLNQSKNAKAGKPYNHVKYEVNIKNYNTDENFDDHPDADIHCKISLIDPVSNTVIDFMDYPPIKSEQGASTDKVSNELDSAGWGYAKTASGKYSTSSGSGANKTEWKDAGEITKLPDFQNKFPPSIVSNLRGGRVRSDGKVMSIELN